MVCAAFAEGCGGKLVEPDKAGKNVAVYGILRGCGEAMLRAKHYFYIDHGFFQRSNPSAGDGYYRVLHNRMWPESKPDGQWDRFEGMGIKLHPWRKTGRHIVVVPPTPYMTEFLDLHGWLDYTLAELDRTTGREIVVSEKSGVKINDLLDNAWCVVTEHSNAGIDAAILGVPVIFTSPERKLGNITEIENPPLVRNYFSRLANSQFTLEEMRSGFCWNVLTSGI